ncbi:MAG TPA: tetratricopeptide repeat protein [Candidatus Eisenbacteria bacterium]|jgi:Tfp pilus assembly protein PilF
MTLARERAAAEAHVEAGVAWLGHGECARAEAELTLALARDSGCPGAPVGLARVCFRSGRLLDALGLLRGALERDPADLDAQLLLAVCRSQLVPAGAFEPALSRAVELLLVLPPADLVPWDPARRVAAAAANLEALRTAVAERPRYADRRLALASKLLVEGEAWQAAAELESALAINPEYLEARLLAARAYLEQDRPEVALDHLRGALRVHPDYPDLHFWSGLALARARRFSQSAKSLERALGLNRHFARAQRLRAMVCHALGRTQEALRAARCGWVREEDVVRGTRWRCRPGRRIVDEPENPFENQTPEEALLVAAIRLQPSYPDLRLQLARVRRARGDLVQARAACREALAIEPAYPEARLELGRLELDLGSAPRAVPLLRQVVLERPRWADARALLARASQALPR